MLQRTVPASRGTPSARIAGCTRFCPQRRVSIWSVVTPARRHFPPPSAAMTALGRHRTRHGLASEMGAPPSDQIASSPAGPGTGTELRRGLLNWFGDRDQLGPHPMHAAEHQGRADSKEADRRSLGSSSHLTQRWRKRDSNSQSHLKEEAAGLHLVNSAGPLSIARAHSELVAPRTGRGGTTSSNPPPSSRESTANLHPLIVSAASRPGPHA